MNKRVVDAESIDAATVDLHKKLRLADDDSFTIDGCKYILDDRMSFALSYLKLCFDVRLPALLEGPPSSGKSTVLSIFSHLQGVRAIVVHVGEQSDPKSLVGTYVTTAEGHFRWKAGILTRAVRDGALVVLEDLQSASPELISMIRPLLETGKLTSSTTTITAHPNFRLLATCTHAVPSVEKLFLKIHLREPTTQAITSIIQGKFPSLGVLIPLVMSVYERTQSIPQLVICATMGNLLRLCRRLYSLDRELLNNADGSIDIQMRELLLLEVADCFTAHLSLTHRISLLVSCCDLLGLSQGEIVRLLEAREPAVSFDDVQERLTIGRVAFKRKGLLTDLHQGMAPTRLSLQVLEKLAVSIKMNEPVLLVGETGTGKTTMVQNLAKLFGQQQLVVLNLSQQSEASDLLGGFRPLSFVVAAQQVVEEFEGLFVKTFSRSKNTQYLSEVMLAFQRKSWERLLKLLIQVISLAKQKASVAAEWTTFEGQVHRLYAQYRAGPEAAYFAFIEGALVKALEAGHWILLDEINLAGSEALDILSRLLQPGASSSIFLGERGDNTPLVRHPNFRLFACMNPATDVSKKNLAPALRSKFSEFYVDETDTFPSDLRMIVGHCLGAVHGMTPIVREAVVNIYYAWKEAIREHQVVDGSRKVPLLNLRTLTRALRFAQQCEPIYGAGRALYEGLAMTFLTTLDEPSAVVARMVVLERLGELLPKGFNPDSPAKVNPAIMQSFTKVPSVLIEGCYQIPIGPEDPVAARVLEEQFVLTPSVRRNVVNLARAIMAGGHPVLLEGPTSAGKTSVVEYLAKLSGHRFVRINNHEHTDIQEYIGAYQPDEQGRLSFQEGLLVEALRKGYWIVLDELNLAPSDVLEALNRLLDDNRELYISEIGKVVKPHPAFLLFATQNPAGLYGGRKVLSKAFRSRFIEVQCPELPAGEVEAILCKRAALAPSHAAKLSKVYTELQQRRTGTNVFAGRQAMITLRDLFRWAKRPMVTAEDLAGNGYLVLGERLRREEEKLLVRETIERIFKVKLEAEDRLYHIPSEILSTTITTWTKAMRRLFSLVHQAIINGEPVLLVGETGCGKTTVCQVLAKVLARQLVILNCHQNSETADFLGSLRPSRDGGSSAALFEWHDGPLIDCMRNGKLLLLDEISLADDSVLERLNSVLEPNRTLTLAEAISGEEIKAVPNFALLATMNPGGDYGKKELSPALRNRFTEIWVPSIGDAEDLIMILAERLGDAGLARRMIAFVEWWREHLKRYPVLKKWPFSIRDVVSWADFVLHLGKEPAYVYEAAVALFMDPARSVATTTAALDEQVQEFVNSCEDKLREIFGIQAKFPKRFVNDDRSFGIEPFVIKKGPQVVVGDGFTFDCPTSSASLWRILRAMSLDRSILLEGSPGVGKTSIISAIASASGHPLVRINLSEQTDLLDLFGSDMPESGGSGFAWVDGPFLQGLKQGAWILLDELNLASQSVLEGLNACLDHRGAVYIPELDKTFIVSQDTRIFGAQNPVKQGGGRKGLPQSFLNRFVTVWIDPLTGQDMQFILEKQAPTSLPIQTISAAIAFIQHLQSACEARVLGIKGAPWEFNLRDLFRWMELCRRDPQAPPEELLKLVFASRMRSRQDCESLISILKQYFPLVSERPMEYSVDAQLNLLHLGNMKLDLGKARPCDLDIMPSKLPALEALVACHHVGWLSILYGFTGKSSLVRLLASLCGQDVMQVTLSANSDTADLLGSFEQTGAEEEIMFLLDEISSMAGRPVTVDEVYHNPQFSEYAERIRVWQENPNSLVFTWKDGPLVRALTRGEWLILDGTNQCPPSVLDRLNCLFEPNGKLVLTEASSAKPRVLSPHPNFRAFMICNGLGEMSRAMRNRGLEIALLDPVEPATGILEDLSVIRAQSEDIDNALALKVWEGTGDSWHELSHLGRVVGHNEHNVAFFDEQRPAPKAPEPIAFWFNARISVFGRAPLHWVSSITAWCRDNLKVRPEVWSVLPQTGFVLISPSGQLLNEQSNELAIVVQPPPPEDVHKEWRSYWKGNLWPLQQTDPQVLRLLRQLARCPPCNNIYDTISPLLLQTLALSQQGALLEFSPPSSADSHLPMMDKLCSTLIRTAFVPLVVDAGWPLLSVCPVDGSLDLRQALDSTLFNYVEYLGDAKLRDLKNKPALSSLLISNTINIPVLQKLLSEALGDGQSVAQEGLAAFRQLVSGYSAHDPAHYYATVLTFLSDLVAFNEELANVQTTLRALLFGDYQLPNALQNLLTEQVDTLGETRLLAGGFEAGRRSELVSFLSGMARDVLPALSHASPANYVHALDNIAAIRKRLAASISADVLDADIKLPILRALDLISIGIEWQMVIVNIKPNSQFGLSLIDEKGYLSSRHALSQDLHLYLSYRKLETAFGYYEGPEDMCELPALLNELYNREKQIAFDLAPSTFDGADEETQETKIIETMFSANGAKKNEEQKLIQVAQSLDALFSRKDPDVHSALHELTRTLRSNPKWEVNSFRLLLESAYRNAPQPTNFNIYHDADEEEAQLAINAISKFAIQLKALLAEYPEHDTLQTLGQHCERFLDLPIAAPLMNLLTSLEALLGKANSWQTLADRSRQMDLEPITSLIIKWRRRELEGWRTALAAVDQKYREAAYIKFFWLCKVLSQESFDERGEELVQLLDTFCLAAPLGELRYRLEVLKRAISYPFVSSAVARLVTQTHNYYTIIVESRLTKYVGEHRHGVGSDLRAALVTIVWRDSSYWTVRQTVDKSHRLIAKQIRKYRDLLDQPTSIILSKLPVGMAGGDLSTCGDQGKQKIARAKAAPLNAGQLVNVAWRRLSGALNRTESMLMIENVERLSETIILRLQELGRLKKASDVQIKQKALVELLRQMRTMGLRLATPYKTEEATVACMIARASKGEVSDQQKERSEEYLARSLSIWQEVSNSAAHEDLGARQVEATKALMFRLLEFSISIRTLSVGSLGDLREYQKQVETSLSGHAKLVEPFRVQSLLAHLEKSRLAARQALALIKPHTAFQPTTKALENHLGEVEVSLSGVIRDLQSIKCVGKGQGIWIDSTLLESINERILHFRTRIFAEMSASVDDFMAPLTFQLSTLPLLPILTVPLAKKSTGDLTIQLQLLIQRIEARFTGTASRIEDLARERDEFDFYPDYFVHVLGLLRDVGVQALMDDVKTTVGKLLDESFGTSAENRDNVLGMVRLIIDSIARFASLVASLCHSLLKLTLVCSSAMRRLINQGFCRPLEETPEPSKDQSKGKELEAGTGMGEGEGEQNVSNEIEFEEQITDLMNPDAEQDDVPEDDEKEEKGGKEDDRIEMREDFSAETKDAQDEDETDDEQQKKMEEEAEDEMGDTGPKGETQELDDGWDQPLEEEEAKDFNEATKEEQKAEETSKDLPEKSKTEPGELEATEQGPLKDMESQMERDQQDDKDDETVANQSKEESNEETSEPQDEAMECDDNDSEDEQNGELETEGSEGGESDDKVSEGEEYETDDIGISELENQAPVPTEADAPTDEISDEATDETTDEQAQDQQEKGEEQKHGETLDNQTMAMEEDGASHASPDTLQKAIKVDGHGQSNQEIETLAASAVKRSQASSGARPQPTPIDEALERVRRSIHQIMSESGKNRPTKDSQNAPEVGAEQMFEQAEGESKEFALGASETHQGQVPKADEVTDQNGVGEDLHDQSASEDGDIEMDTDSERIVEANPRPTSAHPTDDEKGQAQGLEVTDPAKALPSWEQVEAETHDLAADLCEQLRLVLEPTKATKLRGDYRTGKRLNLRRIPSYIASHYRRDKIWLRRTKPSARTYRITLSVDNSKSMQGKAGRLALSALATTATALTRLEAGEINVTLFGEEARCLHPFGRPWTMEVGRSIREALSFSEEHTNVLTLLETINEQAYSADNGGDWQLHVILSDGICHDHAALAPLINAGLAARVIHLFVILDASVVDIQHVQYVPAGIKMTKYLETFPFQFYVVLCELAHLPMVLADSIRQWFETVALLD